jgi:hypothetical protein
LNQPGSETVAVVMPSVSDYVGIFQRRLEPVIVR